MEEVHAHTDQVHTEDLQRIHQTIYRRMFRNVRLTHPDLDGK